MVSEQIVLAVDADVTYNIHQYGWNLQPLVGSNFTGARYRLKRAPSIWREFPCLHICRIASMLVLDIGKQ